MMRGTFANIRLKNQMVPGVEGRFHASFPDRRQQMAIYVAMRFQKGNAAG